MKADLTVVSETETDSVLPALIDGVTISWNSDNTAISDSGTVTRAESDITVTLTW